MKTVFVSLGSNIDNKQDNLQAARKEIAAIEGIQIKKESSLYITSPWGNINQEDFVNQVVKLKTDSDALELLHKFQDIEIKMGRQRKEKWGPRTIDLDILLFGDEVIESNELKIPHPHMFERLFVLVPLAEIESELVFPNGTRIREVLSTAEARDRDNYVKRIN